MVSRISHSMESGRSEDLRAVAIRPEKRISIYWTKVSMHALGGEAASGRWTRADVARNLHPPSFVLTLRSLPRVVPIVFDILGQ
jgi:hypothetical protein